MEQPPARLLPPYLGAVMLLLLGSLLVVTGISVRDVDFDGDQFWIDPGEVMVEAVVVEHTDGWPLGKLTEVRLPDMESPIRRAVITGWVGAPGETIPVIVPTRADRDGLLWGRFAPPPESPRPPVDYSGMASLFGYGFVGLGLAMTIRDFRGRRSPAAGQLG